MREIFTYGSVGRAPGDRCLYPEQGILQKPKYIGLQGSLLHINCSRSEALLDAHRLVRAAARLKDLRYRVEPHLPPDALGIYVYFPAI